MKIQLTKNKRMKDRTLLLVCSFLLIMTFGSVLKAYSDTITVNSPVELLPYLDDDNVTVKVAPGTYTITANDITNGTFTDFTTINGNKAYVLFLFEGHNSTYDFTGVTINVKTEVFNAIKSDAGDFFQIQITGNSNIIKNLTMVDVGSVNDFPKYGCVNVVMDGRDNRVEGFNMTVKGSYPYGYGDCFGKGGTYTIKHWKHSAFLIRGLRNYALNDTIIHRSYGHAMFMQAASYPTIEGCYIEGEMRSTDDMLAETSGPAYDINFYTVWGYRLPPGFMKSLGEGGIRAYNGGNTVIDGVEYSRGTDNPTILNCYVKNMRTGVTLTHATGTKYVKGCTTIGTERGYATGAGIIDSCFSDCQYGPVFGVDYESDRNITVDITILPYEGETYNGDKYCAYLTGSGHNITFKSLVPDPDQDLKIEFGGDRRIIANLNEVENYKAENITLNNYTNYPIVLNSISNGNSGVSGGMVTDFGTNNHFTHTSVSTGRYEAEDYANASGVAIEATTDEGVGQDVTSIESDDYMEYDIDVPFSGTYLFDYRVASASVDGDFTVTLGAETLENVTFTATGGAQTWTTVTSPTPVVLEKGMQTIKVTANSSGWNFNWFDLTLQCARVDIKPYVEVSNLLGETVNAEDSFKVVTFPGNTVSLQPGPSVGGTWNWTGPDGFTANTRVIELTGVSDADAGEYVATITNDCGQQSTAAFTVTVTGSMLIEAEAYSDNNGIGTEATSDVGAGENVTLIDAGDWMEYTIDVLVPATYTVDYRVASAINNGDLTLSVDGENVDQLSFTATGGAQDWITTGSNHVIYLTEGQHTIRITANSTGWNINWLKLVGQDYVSPCNLPLITDGFDVRNETVKWSTGLMDITCVSSVNVYVELSETGTLTPSDSLHIYYRLDGGTLTEISKNTGSLSEPVCIVKGLSGTTLELIINGASTSADHYYSVDKISVVESTDPFARIEAEDFDDKDAGISTSTSRLGSIEPGGWSMYAGLDLTGAISINASVGTVNSDAYIEVRLNAVDGPLIGTIVVPNTGNYNSYRTASTYIDELTGIYDVYLVYQTVSSANVCNIDWFQFSDAFVKRPTNPYERFEAEINDGESGTVATATTDVDGNEELGSLEDGDYIMFSALDIAAADDIDVRVASALDGGVIEVRLGSVTGDIISFIDVPNTGSADTWQTVSTRVDHVVGEHDVYFVFRGEGSDLFQLNWLQFTIYKSSFSRLEAEDSDSSYGNLLIGSTSDAEDDGLGSILRFTYPGNWVQFADVDLTGAKSVNARYCTTSDDAFIEVRIDAPDGELIGDIELENTGSFSTWGTANGSVSSVSGVHDVYFVYQTETSSVVCGSNWFQFSGLSLPETLDTTLRIEAEDYDRASGTIPTATSDVDGERELGAIKSGDWILFKNIDLTDLTNIDVRVASPNTGSRIELRYGSYDGGSLLAFVMLPNTGSSTNWQTVNADLYSAEGVHNVYLVFKGGDSDNLLNINWLQFNGTTSALTPNRFGQDIQFYPNPLIDKLTITDASGSRIELYNAVGKLISVTPVENIEQTLNLSKLSSGYYVIRVIKSDGTFDRFKVVKK
jgi:hypothetical protein